MQTRHGVTTNGELSISMMEKKFIYARKVSTRVANVIEHNTSEEESDRMISLLLSSIDDNPFVLKMAMGSLNYFIRSGKIAQDAITFRLGSVIESATTQNIPTVLSIFENTDFKFEENNYLEQHLLAIKDSPIADSVKQLLIQKLKRSTYRGNATIVTDNYAKAKVAMTAPLQSTVLEIVKVQVKASSSYSVVAKTLDFSTLQTTVVVNSKNDFEEDSHLAVSDLGISTNSAESVYSVFSTIESIAKAMLMRAKTKKAVSDDDIAWLMKTLVSRGLGCLNNITEPRSSNQLEILAYNTSVTFTAPIVSFIHLTMLTLNKISTNQMLQPQIYNQMAMILLKIHRSPFLRKYYSRTESDDFLISKISGTEDFTDESIRNFPMSMSLCYHVLQILIYNVRRPATVQPFDISSILETETNREIREKALEFLQIQAIRNSYLVDRVVSLSMAECFSSLEEYKPTKKSIKNGLHFLRELCKSKSTMDHVKTSSTMQSLLSAKENNFYDTENIIDCRSILLLVFQDLLSMECDLPKIETIYLDGKALIYFVQLLTEFPSGQQEKSKIRLVEVTARLLLVLQKFKNETWGSGYCACILSKLQTLDPQHHPVAYTILSGLLIDLDAKEVDVQALLQALEKHTSIPLEGRTTLPDTPVTSLSLLLTKVAAACKCALDASQLLTISKTLIRFGDTQNALEIKYISLSWYECAIREFNVCSDALVCVIEWCQHEIDEIRNINQFIWLLFLDKYAEEEEVLLSSADFILLSFPSQSEIIISGDNVIDEFCRHSISLISKLTRKLQEKDVRLLNKILDIFERIFLLDSDTAQGQCSSVAQELMVFILENINCRFEEGLLAAWEFYFQNSISNASLTSLDDLTQTLLSHFIADGYMLSHCMYRSLEQYFYQQSNTFTKETMSFFHALQINQPISTSFFKLIDFEKQIRLLERTGGDQWGAKDFIFEQIRNALSSGVQAPLHSIERLYACVLAPINGDKQNWSSLNDALQMCLVFADNGYCISRETQTVLLTSMMKMDVETSFSTIHCLLSSINSLQMAESTFEGFKWIAPLTTLLISFEEGTKVNATTILFAKFLQECACTIPSHFEFSMADKIIVTNWINNTTTHYIVHSVDGKREFLQSMVTLIQSLHLEEELAALLQEARHLCGNDATLKLFRKSVEMKSVWKIFIDPLPIFSQVYLLFHAIWLKLPQALSYCYVSFWWHLSRIQGPVTDKHSKSSPKKLKNFTATTSQESHENHDADKSIPSSYVAERLRGKPYESLVLQIYASTSHLLDNQMVHLIDVLDIHYVEHDFAWIGATKDWLTIYKFFCVCSDHDDNDSLEAVPSRTIYEIVKYSCLLVERGYPVESLLKYLAATSLAKNKRFLSVCYHYDVNFDQVRAQFADASSMNIRDILNKNSLEQSTVKSLFMKVSGGQKDEFLCVLCENYDDYSSNSKFQCDLLEELNNRVKLPQTPETVAVILCIFSRIHQKCFQNHLNNSQIIACAAAISKYLSNTDKQKIGKQGRLLEVKTGEGKTTIISVLAAYFALRGMKVDIITSSPVLAKRDSMEKALFYSSCGLSCGSNDDVAQYYISKQKQCYAKEIVYGDASQFQFDYLRHVFYSSSTFGKRYDDRHNVIALVDEVDNMLIDEATNIARLSTNVAGADLLQPLYFYLWHRLQNIMDGLAVSADGKCTLQLSVHHDSSSSSSSSSDCATAEAIESSSIKTLSFDTFHEAETEITAIVRETIEHLLANDIVLIPSCFYSFVVEQVPNWVESAFTAMMYEENKHYIVEDGLIKPVNYQNSGIILDNTCWSDGLHQFLQVKHNLPITTESLTSNFISTATFFKLYKENFIGLTGTLGSKEAVRFLESTYNCDTMQIPSLRTRQFRELIPTISSNTADWMADICESALYEAGIGRSVLILCETIQVAMNVRDLLGPKCSSRALRFYTMNRSNQEGQIESIQSGDIIIATNLAGRGTDIKINNSIDINGGLHVIVTFIPNNQRVEDQAFGRTARQGRIGSGQMIINGSCLAKPIRTIAAARDDRDQQESKFLRNLQEETLFFIEAKDFVFSKFCEFLESKKAKFGDGSNSRDQVEVNFAFLLKSLQNIDLKSLKQIYSGPSCFYELIRDWRNSVDFKDKSIKEFFNCMCNKERRSSNQEPLNFEFLEDESIYFYPISVANMMLATRWKISSPWLEAKSFYDACIARDLKISQEQSPRLNLPTKTNNNNAAAARSTCAAAHAGLAWAALLEGADNHKSVAASEFQAALEIISSEKAVLCSHLQLLSDISSVDISLQCNNLKEKLSLLEAYSSSLETAQGVIQRSRRLVDIRPTDLSAAGVESLEKQEITRKKDFIENLLKRFSNSNTTLDITFHDLTFYEDTFRFDQAIDTLKSFNRIAMGEKKGSVSIKLNNVSRDNLLLLFNEDLVLNNMTPEQILTNIQMNHQTFLEKLGLGILSDNTTKAKLLRHKEDDEGDTVEVKLSSETIAAVKAKLEEKDEKRTAVQYSLVLPGINQHAKHIIAKKLYNHIDLELINQSYAAVQSMLTKLSKLSFCCGQIVLHFPIKAGEVNLNFDQTVFPTNGVSFRLFNLCNKENAVHSSTPSNDSNVDSSENILTLEQLKSKLHSSQGTDTMFDFQIHLNVITGSQVEALGTVLDKLVSDNIRVLLAMIVSFKGLSLTSEVVKVVGQGSSELVFQGMTPANALQLVPTLRDLRLEFELTFKNLSQTQSSELLLKAKTTQEAVVVNKVRKISDLFNKNDKPEAELSNYSKRGIEYLIEVSERAFVPWLSIIIVLVLAYIQVQIGLFLIATGFGAKVGVAFITEGVADLFTALMAYQSRGFTWKDYVMQKAVSLVIAAVCIGVGRIKDTAKAMDVASKTAQSSSQVAVGVGKEAIQETALKSMKESSKELSKLGTKYAGVVFAEHGARHVGNSVVNSLSDASMNLIQPKLSEYIQHVIEEQYSHLMRPLIVQLSWKNCLHWNQQADYPFYTELSTKVDDFLNPSSSLVEYGWENVAAPLLNGILSDPNHYGSNAAMVFRIVGTIQGLTQLVPLISNIMSQVLVFLSLEAGKVNFDTLLKQELELQKEITKTNSTSCSDFLQKEGLLRAEIVKHPILGNSHARTVYLFNRDRLMEGFTGDFLSNMATEYQCREDAIFKNNCEWSKLIRAMGDKITSKIINVAQSKMIKPWTSYAVGKGVSSVSKRLQDRWIRKYERIGQEKLEEEARKEKESPQPNSNANNGYQYQTYSGLIDYEATKLMKAFCTHEVHVSKNLNNKKVTSASQQKNVDKFASLVVKGKPASIIELTLLLLANDLKDVAIYDAKDDQEMLDIPLGKPAIVFLPGKANADGIVDIGHYVLRKADGSIHDPSSTTDTSAGGRNLDCGYLVIQALLKDQSNKDYPVDELRRMTADSLRNNSAAVLNAVLTAQYANQRFRADANTINGVGGGANRKAVVTPSELDHLERLGVDPKKAKMVLTTVNYPGNIGEIEEQHAAERVKRTVEMVAAIAFILEHPELQQLANYEQLLKEIRVKEGAEFQQGVGSRNAQAQYESGTVESLSKIPLEATMDQLKDVDFAHTVGPTVNIYEVLMPLVENDGPLKDPHLAAAIKNWPISQGRGFNIPRAVNIGNDRKVDYAQWRIFQETVGKIVESRTSSSSSTPATNKDAAFAGIIRSHFNTVIENLRSTSATTAQEQQHHAKYQKGLESEMKFVLECLKRSK